MREKGPITYFGLLRHAETEWNREKRIQGQQDAPLTSHGRQQAESWGRALERYQLDYLLSSDLGRAAFTDSPDKPKSEASLLAGPPTAGAGLGFLVGYQIQ